MKTGQTQRIVLTKSSSSSWRDGSTFVGGVGGVDGVDGVPTARDNILRMPNTGWLPSRKDIQTMKTGVLRKKMRMRAFIEDGGKGHNSISR
jgi:hypothetical protein